MSVVLDKISNVRLSELLLAGKIGVIPTDTVYGLVCSATDENAVRHLYALKHRNKKPGTIIAASVQQLVDLGLKARYLKPVEHYWPNPISVIIPCTFELPYLHLGVGSLAVRIPANQDLLSLLEKSGPLLTTSANHPGQPEAVNLEEAQKYFANDVDFYVEGGYLSHRKPSTVIRVVDDMVEVLREGAIIVNEKGELLE